MKKTELIFITNKKFGEFEGERLRGFISNLFTEETILHNHINEYEFLYESSKIQYKVIDGYLAIIGLGDEAASLLNNKLKNLKNLKIGDDNFLVKDIIFNTENFILEVEKDLFYEYEFSHHWIGLNQENYKKYLAKELSLERALQNNIIELFKMCGFQAKERIIATTELFEENIKRKDIFVKGFKGKFKINVLIPDNLGLGKRKSVGFGTIKRINK